MSKADSIANIVDTKAPLSNAVAWFLSSAFCLVKNKLLGRVLTVIDASISDPEQRKALKDVLKEVFQSTHVLEWDLASYARIAIARICGDDIEGSIPWSSEFKDLTQIVVEGYKYTRTEI